MSAVRAHIRMMQFHEDVVDIWDIWSLRLLKILITWLNVLKILSLLVLQVGLVQEWCKASSVQISSSLISLASFRPKTETELIRTLGLLLDKLTSVWLPVDTKLCLVWSSLEFSGKVRLKDLVWLLVEEDLVRSHICKFSTWFTHKIFDVL